MGVCCATSFRGILRDRWTQASMDGRFLSSWTGNPDFQLDAGQKTLAGRKFSGDNMTPKASVLLDGSAKIIAPCL